MGKYDLSKYGLENCEVEIAPWKNFRLTMDLSKDSREKLERIFHQDKAKLVPLLEDIVEIVNSSICFGGTAPTINYLIEKYGYKPTGREAVVGDCNQSGDAIREILYALRIKDIDFEKETCGGIRVPVAVDDAHSAKILHDCTVVSYKGRWAVLNSKSPSPDRQYGIVPKDKLVCMGPPFVPNKDYQKAMSSFLTKEEKDKLKKIDALFDKRIAHSPKGPVFDLEK